MDRLDGLAITQMGKVAWDWKESGKWMGLDPFLHANMAYHDSNKPAKAVDYTKGNIVTKDSLHANQWAPWMQGNYYKNPKDIPQGKAIGHDPGTNRMYTMDQVSKLPPNVQNRIKYSNVDKMPADHDMTNRARDLVAGRQLSPDTRTVSWSGTDPYQEYTRTRGNVQYQNKGDLSRSEVSQQLNQANTNAIRARYMINNKHKFDPIAYNQQLPQYLKTVKDAEALNKRYYPSNMLGEANEYWRNVVSDKSIKLQDRSRGSARAGYSISDPVASHNALKILQAKPFTDVKANAYVGGTAYDRSRQGYKDQDEMARVMHGYGPAVLDHSGDVTGNKKPLVVNNRNKVTGIPFSDINRFGIKGRSTLNTREKFRRGRIDASKWPYSFDVGRDPSFARTVSPEVTSRNYVKPRIVPEPKPVTPAEQQAIVSKVLPWTDRVSEPISGPPVPEPTPPKMGKMMPELAGQEANSDRITPKLDLGKQIAVPKAKPMFSFGAQKQKAMKVPKMTDSQAESYDKKYPPKVSIGANIGQQEIKKSVKQATEVMSGASSIPPSLSNAFTKQKGSLPWN